MPSLYPPVIALCNKKLKNYYGHHVERYQKIIIRYPHTTKQKSS